MLLAKTQRFVLEQQEEHPGYHMIKSLTVKNFRCFEDIQLSDFRRVNVIVGRNAAGKTALLEAIRLALGGTPQAAFQLNNVRGVLYFGIMQSREQFEALWNPLFFKFETSRTISTEVSDSNGHQATVAISYDASRTVTSAQQQPLAAPTVTIIPIKFVSPWICWTVN
jgi:predicted ATPase